MTGGWPLSSFTPATQVARAFELRESPDGFPDNAFIDGLVELWRDTRRDGRLPARQDFPLERLRPWLGRVSLIEVEHGPLHFRWRLVGSDVATQLGRDSTGRRFDEIYEEPWLSKHLQSYATAVTRRGPAYFSGNLEYVDKEYRRFRSVHLPLASDGQTVDMLMICVDFRP